MKANRLAEPMGPTKETLTKATAQVLKTDSLSEGQRTQLIEWASNLRHRQTHNDPLTATTPLELMMVVRALSLKEGSFSSDEHKLLRQTYETGFEQLTGKAPPQGEPARLPLWSDAMDDRRVRLLQSAIFREAPGEKGIRDFIGDYRPTLGDLAAVAGLLGVSLTSPAAWKPIAAFLGSLAFGASGSEHQIHSHIMHPSPEVARFMMKHKDNPLVKAAYDFFFIHKGVHHGQSFLRSDVEQFGPGEKAKVDKVLEQLGRLDFGKETNYGLNLTTKGMIGTATMGVSAVALAGLLLGMGPATAVALGLPMALMPIVPHFFHKYAHLTHTEKEEVLKKMEAEGGTWGKLKSTVMRAFIESRAMDTVARLHNQHHLSDTSGKQTNMSMLAAADLFMGTAEPASFALLADLWNQDAIGFPAAPPATEEASAVNDALVEWK